MHSGSRGTSFFIPFQATLLEDRRATPFLFPVLVGMEVARTSALHTLAQIREEGLKQMDVDIRYLWFSVDNTLYAQVDSLAEVVFPNQQELRGGICL